MNAEDRIRQAVRDVIAAGDQPSPMNILGRLGRLGRHNPRTGGDRLNGSESRWRADELRANGYRKNKYSGRWAIPTKESDPRVWA